VVSHGLYVGVVNSPGPRQAACRKKTSATSGRFVGLLFSLVLAATGVARADGLVGHSVTYDVKPLKEDKAVYLEGQASSTI